MASSPNTQAFTRANEAFRSTISDEDAEDFKYTKLEDLKVSIQNIQANQGRRSQNLSRLKPFLEGMEQYGQLVEVFLNVSGILAFVWGPTKFFLQVTSNHVQAFDELLDVYSQIGENLPMLAQYESLFRENSHMRRVLEQIYTDILNFNCKAYKYFKKPIWKQIFQATWKSFRSQFSLLISNLHRHKQLVETQANLAQFEEIQTVRLTAETEFGNLRKAEELRRKSEVLEWLSPANMAEDQDMKSRARRDYPGVCNWILQDTKVRKWRDLTTWTESQSFLWIHGIPGAGKTTLASFLIEELKKLPSALTLFFYCKYEDCERNSFVALAKALIAQAAAHLDSDLLAYIYEETATSGERPLKTSSRTGNILEMVLKSLGQVYVIIDGLDECEVAEKSMISTWFQKFVQNEPPDSNSHLRCLFVSQIDKDMGKLLKSIPQLPLGQDRLAQDIRLFCGFEGARIREKFRLSEAECEGIIKRVSDEAKGMFLYAKLVMKHLLDQTRLADLRKELSPDIFPKGIEKAYERILDRILLSSDLSESVRRGSKTLLGLLICAKRPLKWTEIQGSVSIDLQTRQVDYESGQFSVEPKDLCGSLVEKHPGGTVELVHMTVKIYLVKEKHLSLVDQQRKLSRLCLDYLTFECFEYEYRTQESIVEDFIQKGHYIFADYAITYWAEHAVEVINSSDANGLRTIHKLIESLWKYHGNPAAYEMKANIETLIDDSESPESNQKLIEIITSLGEYLDLNQVLSHIRSIMENLYQSDGIKRQLEVMYGADIFKCSRIGCNRFSEGFEELDARDQHQKKHERPFYCTFDGCLGAQMGFTNSDQLQRHIKSNHDPFGLVHFPLLSGTHTSDRFHRMIEAIKSSNTSLIQQLLQENPSGIEFKSIGTGYLHSESTKIWRGAIQKSNDIIIDILEQGTTFLESYAQLEILRIAALEKRLDLVCRFSQAKYIGKRSKTHQRNTTYAALKGDNSAILDTLLNSDIGNIFTSHLHDTAIEASRTGALACLQYLIAEHGINPLQKKTPKDNATGISAFRAQTLLYNAVETGQIAVYRFLLKQQYIDDSYDILARLSARNGHERIIEALLEIGTTLNDSSSQQHLSRARLYHAMRQGRKRIVDSLLYLDLADLDEPDVNGCSLFMYAALHGYLDSVEYLITKGADINRNGNCPEISANSARGQTALLMATYNGHQLVIKRLLQYTDIQLEGRIVFRQGVSLHSPAVAGFKGIIIIAQKRGFPEIVAIFKEARAKNPSAWEEVWTERVKSELV